MIISGSVILFWRITQVDLSETDADCIPVVFAPTSSSSDFLLLLLCALSLIKPCIMSMLPIGFWSPGTAKVGSGLFCTHMNIYVLPMKAQIHRHALVEANHTTLWPALALESIYYPGFNYASRLKHIMTWRLSTLKKLDWFQHHTKHSFSKWTNTSAFNVNCMGLCNNHLAKQVLCKLWSLNHSLTFACSNFHGGEKVGGELWKTDSSCELVLFCFTHGGLPQLVTFSQGRRVTAHWGRPKPSI